MSNWETKKESEEVDATCPKCSEQFKVDVDIEVEVESPDPYITIKVK